MGKVAVLMAEGYEEGETLTIVDILRRADVECHTFAVRGSESGEKPEDLFVKGMHGMMVKADKEFMLVKKEEIEAPHTPSALVMGSF